MDAQSVRYLPFPVYRTTVGLSILALRISTSESSQMNDFFLKHAVSCHEMPSLYLGSRN